MRGASHGLGGQWVTLLTLMVMIGCRAAPLGEEPVDASSPPTFLGDDACGVCLEALEGEVALIDARFGYHRRCFDATPRCVACTLPAGGRRGPPRADRRSGVSCAPCATRAVSDHTTARALLKEAAADLEARFGCRVEVEGLALRFATPAQLASLSGRATSDAKGFMEATRRVEPGGAQPWSVTIHLARGLPEGQLYGIVAHELFHVWQLEASPDELDAAWREGSACYVQWALLWARGEGFWARLVESHTDPVYGGGLRRFRAFAEGRTAAELRRAWRREADFP